MGDKEKPVMFCVLICGFILLHICMFILTVCAWLLLILEKNTGLNFGFRDNGIGWTEEECLAGGGVFEDRLCKFPQDL
jgi:hypothetical protein